MAEHMDALPPALAAIDRIPDLRAQQLAALRGGAVASILFANPADPGACLGYARGCCVVRRTLERQLGAGAGALRYCLLVPRAGPLRPPAEALALCERGGWEVRGVDYLAECERGLNPRLQPAQAHYRYTTGLKLHAFGLEFARVVYLDADAWFADPAALPACGLGRAGCAAELFRLPLGGRRAASVFDGQKGWCKRSEAWWRAAHPGAAHGCAVPLDCTRFDRPEMRGDPGRRDRRYRMMVTGLMVLAPGAEFFAAVRAAVAAIRAPHYSDGDQLTHAVTAARGGWEPGWVAVDPLYGAYRGPAPGGRPAFAVQFGGCPPWAGNAAWPGVAEWRADWAAWAAQN